jgi:hypothetical protein
MWFSGKSKRNGLNMYLEEHALPKSYICSKSEPRNKIAFLNLCEDALSNVLSKKLQSLTEVWG